MHKLGFSDMQRRVMEAENQLNVAQLKLRHQYSEAYELKMKAAMDAYKEQLIREDVYL